MRRELKRWPHLQCGKKVAQVARQEIHTGMLILFILYNSSLMEHLINMLTLCRVHCNWSSSEGEDLHAYWTF